MKKVDLFLETLFVRPWSTSRSTWTDENTKNTAVRSVHRYCFSHCFHTFPPKSVKNQMQKSLRRDAFQSEKSHFSPGKCKTNPKKVRQGTSDVHTLVHTFSHFSTEKCEFSRFAPEIQNSYIFHTFEILHNSICFALVNRNV